MKRAIFSLVLSVLCLNLMAQEGVDTTFVAHANPFVNYKYLADPGALVVGDKLYVYAGHDACPPDREHYLLNEWCILSTSDMKTWHEHSYKMQATDFPWARGEAWASQVIERDGKFYWYITAEHKSVRGKAVGVAVADSPEGPFVPQPEALVTNAMTTEYTGISWDDIDPTVYIDDDGQAYLAWGNTQLYYAKLKDNMVELDGEIMPISIKGVRMPSNPKEWNDEVEASPADGDSNFFTEAPWYHKRKGWYYLSFAIGFPEKTAYAMSRSINGPWEYKGVLNEVAGHSNTNHHAIVEFKGKWYFIYHNGALNTKGSSFRRSLCIDRIYYERNGEMRRVQMTSEGIWGDK